MEPPTTLGQLQQLLGALSWMRMHLPDHAKTVAPLQELLDKGLADLPKRSRRYSDRVPLERLEYGELHAEAFAAVKQMLASAVRLAHHDPSCDVLVFTDASESHWAVACVQAPAEDADKPIQARRMEPPAFLSGAFLGPAGAGPSWTRRRIRLCAQSTSWTSSSSGSGVHVRDGPPQSAVHL